MMKMNTGMRRMDSLMVASDIKKMSQFELLYTCVINLTKFIRKSQDDAFAKPLIHYTEENDHNRVLYHNRSEDYGKQNHTGTKGCCTDHHSLRKPLR